MRKKSKIVIGMSGEFKIQEKKLREIGFLEPYEEVEKIEMGEWKLSGQHYICVVKVYLSNNVVKKFILKCPWDVFGSDAVRAWVDRRVRLSKLIRQAGGNVPRTEKYDDGTLIQEFIEGVEIGRVGEEKYKSALERELKIYEKLGLSYADSTLSNFILTPEGKVYCVDLDFLESKENVLKKIERVQLSWEGMITLPTK